MAERIALITLTVIYLFTFILRNITVSRRTAQPVRARDGFVFFIIFLSTFCFMTAIFSTVDDWYPLMGALPFLRSPLISWIGLMLFAASIALGWVISGQLKDSWRVGVHHNQQTGLINEGLYAHVRNPHFMTYFMMYFSLWLIRPSVILTVLIIAAAILLHRMVLKEESHLLSQHGKTYAAYKSTTGRYLPRIRKNQTR